MKSKAKSVLVFIIAVLLITGGIIGTVVAIRANQRVFKLTMYPGMFDTHTYYYVLYMNHVLSYSDETFCVKRKLNEREMNLLLDMIKDIYENGNQADYIITDVAQLEFCYKGTTYNESYRKDPPNGKLCELLIEMRRIFASGKNQIYY